VSVLANHASAARIRELQAQLQRITEARNVDAEARRQADFAAANAAAQLGRLRDELEAARAAAAAAQAAAAAAAVPAADIAGDGGRNSVPQQLADLNIARSDVRRMNGVINRLDADILRMESELDVLQREADRARQEATASEARGEEQRRAFETQLEQLREEGLRQREAHQEQLQRLRAASAEAAASAAASMPVAADPAAQAALEAAQRAVAVAEESRQIAERNVQRLEEDLRAARATERQHADQSTQLDEERQRAVAALAESQANQTRLQALLAEALAAPAAAPALPEANQDMPAFIDECRQGLVYLQSRVQELTRALVLRRISSVTVGQLGQWVDSLEVSEDAGYLMNFVFDEETNSFSCHGSTNRLCGHEFTWFLVLGRVNAYLRQENILAERVEFEHFVNILSDSLISADLRAFLERNAFHVTVNTETADITALCQELSEFRSAVSGEIREIFAREPRLIFCVYLYCLDIGDTFSSADDVDNIADCLSALHESPNDFASMSDVMRRFAGCFRIVNTIMVNCGVSLDFSFEHLSNGIASFISANAAMFEQI
jgi:outer membrane murein-binding lipoprotein Lpp